jgi:ethanolaminephosphotransferase
MWVAPNCITLTGYLINWIPSIVINMLYGSDLGGHVDSWVCYLLAGCFWTYYIFDCTDGKQARRTGASSPVGMIFDHFCDATVSIYISWCF